MAQSAGSTDAATRTQSGLAVVLQMLAKVLWCADTAFVAPYQNTILLMAAQDAGITKGALHFNQMPPPLPDVLAQHAGRAERACAP
jgi:hypothetical protein